MELTATSWESTIGGSSHIWAVNFHSGMCSSCQAFKPEWEALTHAVDGLCGAANRTRSESSRAHEAEPASLSLAKALG